MERFAEAIVCILAKIMKLFNLQNLTSFRKRSSLRRQWACHVPRRRLVGRRHCPWPMKVRYLNISAITREVTVTQLFAWDCLLYHFKVNFTAATPRPKIRQAIRDYGRSISLLWTPQWLAKGPGWRGPDGGHRGEQRPNMLSACRF